MKIPGDVKKRKIEKGKEEGMKRIFVEVRS